MFRQAENKVKIEGILSETDLKYGSFDRNGEKVDTIYGELKVLVEQVVNGQAVALEVPIRCFSTKMTKKKTVNPAYESIERVMKEFTSIAACGSKEQADRVRITSARMSTNEYPDQSGVIRSYPEITASFISKATGEFKPEASFTVEFMVSSINRALDREGVEVSPAKLNVNVVVPAYTAEGAAYMNIDKVQLVTENPNVINAIEQYWESGQCYRANGRLNFSSKTEEVLEEVDFGEAQSHFRTTSVREFVVTGGSQAPLEGEYAWTVDEIKSAIAHHDEEVKNKIKTNVKKSTPSATTSAAMDLGF